MHTQILVASSNLESGGIIVGISVGAVLFILLVALMLVILTCYIFKSRMKSDDSVINQDKRNKLNLIKVPSVKDDHIYEEVLSPMGDIQLKANEAYGPINLFHSFDPIQDKPSLTL